MEVAEATAKATMVILFLVLVSMGMMLSIAKSARCPNCLHCRNLTQTEERNKRHKTYHSYTDRASARCNDPKCEGRK